MKSVNFLAPPSNWNPGRKPPLVLSHGTTLYTPTGPGYFGIVFSVFARTRDVFYVPFFLSARVHVLCSFTGGKPSAFTRSALVSENG